MRSRRPCQPRSLSVFLAGVIWCGVVLTPPASAGILNTALPAVLHGSTIAAPELAIEDITVLRTLAPGRIPLWPVWSQDGRRIGFTATDPDLMQGSSWLSEIWVMDVASCPAATRLLAESDGATCGSLSFVPDDSALLYIDHVGGEYGGRPALCDAHTAGIETSLGIRPSDLDHAIISGTIYHTDSRETHRGNEMVVDLEKHGADTTVSVYLISMTASGRPDLASATEIIDDVEGISPTRLSLSPSGNELLFAHWHTGSNPDIALIVGLDRIVAGDDPPIGSWSDGRVKIINDGPGYADAPSWSEDGSIFFYGYDFTGMFELHEMNFSDADFDVMAVRMEEALAGNLNPTRLALPGNQGCISVSRGGTRIVFGRSGNPNNEICAATLRVSDEMSIDSGGVVQTAFTLRDGSGSVLYIEPSTVVSDFGTGSDPLKLSVSTPVVVSLGAGEVAQGTVGIGALRVLSYENTAGGGNPDPQPLLFSPAALVELTYTDAEIRGLDEAGLLVYGYDPGTGRFDRRLPVVARDTAANRVTVQLDSIAPVGVGSKSGTTLGEGCLVLGVVDSDGDGLSDGRELGWDGDPGANIYDPDTNPTGTDLNPWSADTDGDGLTDSEEVTFGSNPIDPASTVALPATGLAFVTVLIAWMALAGLLARTRHGLTP